MLVNTFLLLLVEVDCQCFKFDNLVIILKTKSKFVKTKIQFLKTKTEFIKTKV